MITKEAFLSLRPGIDRVKDARGRTYRVVSNTLVDCFPDVPGPKEVVLEDEDNRYRLVLGWHDTTGKIVDDDFSIVVELNVDGATIIVG